MIQLVERPERHLQRQLGNGQRIEAAMAHAVGTKVFRVRAATFGRVNYISESHVDTVVSICRRWYERKDASMDDHEIDLDDLPVPKIHPSKRL